MEESKFCKHCGEKIAADAIICPKCGRQVESVKSEEKQQIIINNTNTNTAVASATAIAQAHSGKAKNKWVAFILCLFLGFFGVHKFYEGKAGKGLLYLCTLGIFGIGWLIDCIVLLFKPNPYYV